MTGIVEAALPFKSLTNFYSCIEFPAVIICTHDRFTLCCWDTNFIA